MTINISVNSYQLVKVHYDVFALLSRTFFSPPSVSR